MQEAEHIEIDTEMKFVLIMSFFADRRSIIAIGRPADARPALAGIGR
jgi:hypothetical protein